MFSEVFQLFEKCLPHLSWVCVCNNSASTKLSIPSSDWRYDGIADKITNVAAGSGASTSIDVLAQPSTAIHPERTKGADAGLSYTYAAPSGNGAIASSGVTSFI